MQVTMMCRPGWQRSREMWDEMKRVIAETGKLADQRPQDLGGYLAERPEGLPHCMRVWAPCGCCWTYMSASASVLTQCDAQEHDFNWTEAEQAIAALRAAEEPEIKEGVTDGKDQPSQQLAIVKRTKT